MNILQWLDSNDVIHFAPERRDRQLQTSVALSGMSAGSFPETAAGNRALTGLPWCKNL